MGVPAAVFVVRQTERFSAAIQAGLKTLGAAAELAVDAAAVPVVAEAVFVLELPEVHAAVSAVAVESAVVPAADAVEGPAVSAVAAALRSAWQLEPEHPLLATFRLMQLPVQP